MSAEEFRSYTRDEFLDEFFPDTEDKTAIFPRMEPELADLPSTAY